MTTSDFRFGLVGCGRISQAYLDAIRVYGGARLTAVMDTRDEAARTAAEAVGARAFTDLGEFVSHGGIDGAIICTPPIHHKEVACTLIENGVHVLCEKPFATTVEDALAMVEAARRADIVLMMASKFRYVEDVIRAKAMIASGSIGSVQFYQNAFLGKVDMRPRWNSDPSVGGGGVLIDNGTHSVDVVRYLLGPIRRVFAYGSRSAGLDVEDTVSLSFITHGEVKGDIRLSWNVQPDTSTYVAISGTEGAIDVGWQQSAYQKGANPKWVPFGGGYDKVSAFVNQVKNFVETIGGSAEPLIRATDGVSSVVAVEAAYRSMETGEWVDVEDRSSTPAIAVAK